MPSFTYKLPTELILGDIIIGEKDNYSEVTGEVEISNTHAGFTRVETEHGILYIENDLKIEVKITQ
jgi:hypothetical protein